MLTKMSQIFSRLPVIVFIIVIVFSSSSANSTSSDPDSTASSSGPKDSPKDIDCTTSYKMWEVTLEDYLNECVPTFCDCYKDNMKCSKWNNDLFDGMAKMWYLQAREQALRMCERFMIYAPEEKDYFHIEYMVISTHNVTFWQVGLNANGITLKRESSRKIDINTISKNFKHNLPTKGLLEMKIRQEHYGVSSSESEPNYGHSSYRSIPIRKGMTPYDYTLFDTRIFGPMGGEFSSDEGYAIINSYLDVKQKDILDFEIQPILLENDYHFRQSTRIRQLSFVTTYLRMCMGRKINPTTNRTHWTGEGCMPQVAAKRSASTSYYAQYDFKCKCQFESLGINAPDDPPELPLVEGFNTSPESGTTTGSPEAGKNIEIRKPSSTTYVVAIFALILLAISLILILITICFVVYYKVIAKN